MGGTALVIGVLVVCLLMWFSQATKLPPDSEMMLGFTAVVTTKISKDLNKGVQPAVAIERGVAALREISHSAEVERCPQDVQNAFREYLAAMEAWKAEAEKLPKSQDERLLRSILNTLSSQSDGGYGETMDGWNSRVREAREAQEHLAAVVQRHKR